MMNNKKAALDKVAASEIFDSPIVPQCDELLQWAIWYSANGYSVFPCRERGKEPLTEHGCKDASTDLDVIRAWWTKWPNANIGIACEPSELVVIDMDSAEAAQEAGRRGMSLGPTVRTVKGFHVYCKVDSDSRLQSKVGILPGIDIRANGGYVIAPPSIHPSGKRYEWVQGRGVWAWTLPDAPAWVYELVGSNPRTDISSLAQGAPNGTRDVSLASVAGHLLRKYVDPHLAEALVYAYGRYMCDPPLDEKQISKVWNSIASRELRRRQRGHS